MPSEREVLLRKREIADYYRVSEGTINRWISEGKLKPVYTPGGSPRFVLPKPEARDG